MRSLIQVTPISDYWNQILNTGETNYAGLIYRVPRGYGGTYSVQNELRTIDDRQLYTSPATFHVPIKGLGYLGEDMDRNEYELILARVKKILEDMEPFEITIKGVHAFPTAIYAGVEDGGNFKKINKAIIETLQGKWTRAPLTMRNSCPTSPSRHLQPEMSSLYWRK